MLDIVLEAEERVRVQVLKVVVWHVTPCNLKELAASIFRA